MKRKPPEKNFVNWDKNTFARLIAAPPERLTSRFQVTHGMLLNVLSRRGDGCRAMQQLMRDCHETPKAQEGAQPARLAVVPRARSSGAIVEFMPADRRTGAKVRVNVDLQDDFSMNQTLSLYVLDTLPLMDPAGAGLRARAC